MAKQTFKNEGGKATIKLAGDADPAAVVEAGGTVSTDNEELKTALRKSGYKVAKSSKESK